MKYQTLSLVVILVSLEATFAFAEEQALDQNWGIALSTSVPLRGFTIQADKQSSGVQDNIDTLNYNASSSLEGAISLRYKEYGFTYKGTLAKENLDAKNNDSSSKIEAFRAGVFFSNKLIEVSSQKVEGFSTSIAVNNSGINKKIFRPDITYSDYHIKAMYGLPVSGGSVNSLANFYSEIKPEQIKENSFDFLYSLELMKESLKGSASFVPIERKTTFGTASSLNQVSSYGAGAGVGAGYTIPTSEQFNISMAAIIGGNLNISKAYYENEKKNISGIGVYANARLSSNYIFGAKQQQALSFRFFLDAWSIPAKENKINSSDAFFDLSYRYFF